MLKGESAKWMNDSKMINDFFDWQKGYFTVGVSESNIPIVRNYLEKQENHHKNYTWKQERKELIEKFGFVEYSED